MHSSASKYFFLKKEKTGQCVQDDLTPKTEEFDTLWHWLFKSFLSLPLFFCWRSSTLQSEATRGGAAAAGRNARLVPFFSLLPGLLTKKSPLDGERGEEQSSVAAAPRLVALARPRSWDFGPGKTSRPHYGSSGYGRTDGRMDMQQRRHTHHLKTLLSFVWINTQNCLNLDIIILLIKRHWTELIAHKVRCCCPVAKVIQLLNSPDGCVYFF